MTLLAHAESRRRNLGRVMRLIHEQGPRRQVQISDSLGLTRSTGISLVEELTGLGLVAERDSEPMGQRGRPSPLIAPSADIVVAAAEIAADTVRLDLVQLGGAVVVGEDLAISPSALGPQHTLRRVATAVADLVAARPALRLVGAVIAVHGAVNGRGRVLFAPNLEWEGADIGAIDALLRRAIPDRAIPPVLVGNDAHLGALGELRRGAGRGRRDFLYLSAERGVGGGLVVNGELVLGGSGLAGEVGHLKVGGSARQCGCGQRGCWETEIGTAAIRRIAGAKSIDAVLDRAEQNDRRAVEGIGGLATWLGRGLGLIVPILQPDLVIVGGHLARIVALARPAVDAAIRDACPPPLSSGIDIVPSALGSDAALIGAAEVAFERLLSDPAAIAAPQEAR